MLVLGVEELTEEIMKGEGNGKEKGEKSVPHLPQKSKLKED